MAPFSTQNDLEPPVTDTDLPKPLDAVGEDEFRVPLIEAAANTPPRPTFWSRVGKFCLKYFLPIGFMGALVFALISAEPGKTLAEIEAKGVCVMQTLCVCVVFIVSGLCFNTSDIKGAVQVAHGMVFGLVSILLLTPMMGFVLMNLDFVPREFRVGLSVMVAAPTTHTLGVALLEQAGGNAALGLLLVILSNSFGILTIPFVIRLTIGSSSDTSIDAVQLLLKLLFTLLTPLILGKIFRESSCHTRGFVRRRRTFLGIVKNGACVVIVWLALSRSREKLLSQKLSEIGTIILLCSVIHCSFLLFNLFSCMILRVRGRERMAVVVMASQKTFPVTVAVISYLDPAQVGDIGLLTIPCAIAHITQLFLDSFLLSKWRYEDAPF